MKAVFISGTDTGVGKTIVSGLLARYLCEKGYRTTTQKWVQTGSRKFSPDVALHLKLMGAQTKRMRQYNSLVCPYVLNFAGSPHLAASYQGKVIRIETIKKSFYSLVRNFDFVVVEGVGGALVPFNRKKLIIDVVKDLRLPVIIVAANKLGAINHTLLTLEALRARKMKIIGVVFNNNRKGENKIIARDNPRIVKELSKENVLGILPWESNKDLLYKKFVPIGKKIASHFLRNNE